MVASPRQRFNFGVGALRFLSIVVAVFDCRHYCGGDNRRLVGNRHGGVSNTYLQKIAIMFHVKQIE